MSDPATPRASYADLESPAEMRADARRVGDNLRLERVARAAARPAPRLTYDEFPREVHKRDIAISEAAARLAGALHLHLN